MLNKYELDITTVTDAIKLVNEDGYVNKLTAFAVIDGATSLGDIKVDGYINNAVWITEETKKFLNNNLEGHQIHLDDFATSKDYMDNLIFSLNKHLQKEYRLVCDNNSREAEPSCGVAIGKIYGDKIQLAIVGDLTMIIKLKNGEFIELQDTRLKNLDDFAITEMIKLAKERGIQNLEARPLINDILIKNRNMKNTIGGYSVISTDNVLLDGIINKSFSLDDIDTIYAFSDGVAELYDTLSRFGNYQYFINMLVRNDNNPQAAITLLRASQEADSHCNKFPRFKKGDDATLSIIKIKNI